MLRTLDRAGDRVASVVLTGSESQNDYVQVVRLGARGLVLKGDEPEQLFAAIRAVAEGELAFSDEIADGVMNAMVSDAQPAVPGSLRRLSERERQISYMVARGMRNRDIAADADHQREHGEAPPAEHLFQERIARPAGAGGAGAQREQQGRRISFRRKFCSDQRPAVAAIFFTMAITSLRSLSFRLGE